MSNPLDQIKKNVRKKDGSNIAFNLEQAEQ